MTDMNGLTVIIPFLNEGGEVERTLESVRSTAASPVEILLVNDCSDDGYGYRAVAGKYGCRYIEHETRKGVAASRDEGAALCRTEDFLLLDAHMEFYEKGWDAEISRVLQENPESILCCQTRILDAARKRTKPSSAFGAFLALDRENILKCRWNRHDSDPEAPVAEVPVVLGGAYAARKSYWQHLHGLKGLVRYGMDEELISMKCWTEGGRCLLLKNLEAGHIYRRQFPYPVTNGDVLHNKIFIAELFFGGEARKNILDRLKGHYGENLFGRVYGDMDRDLIESECRHLKAICRKNTAYFLYKNVSLRQS
ncbi:MAG: glycosyltransferase [Tannerella sp.]|jgi:glycosyltransferase involved in cell wall biosynthesis|nr:glycosyltransferase [Tannerella sp.]